MRNEFVYRKVRKQCVGQSDNWVKMATNEILETLTQQINKDGKAPGSEQLDRYETVLEALRDELDERGVK